MAKKTINVIYKVDDKELVRLKQALGLSEQQAKKLSGELDKTGKEAQEAGSQGSKSFMDFNNVLKSISIAILAKQLLDFTKEVIAVRGEFQKFEAVLTNTLGSRSAALIALARINEFAKSTPFGVSELTNAFIKLANRGVEPTIKEMRAIADLSATLGKDFDQVVEALLDINNPERWKEIGIKAETAGDKVSLSFRNTTIEVDRTVRGVTDAVVALGQLNGVAGSTEAISRTLAGQTSNLNDSWEQLLNTIGKGNEGVLFETVSLLSRAIDLANDLLKSNAQQFEELESRTLATETEEFKKLAEAFGNIDKARDAFIKKTEDRIASLSRRFQQLSNSMEKVPTFNIPGGENPEEIKNRNMAREAEMKQLNSLIDIYMFSLPDAIDETIKKMDQGNGENKKSVGIIEDLEKQIESLNKQIKATQDRGDLGAKGVLIKQLKELQDELDKLRGKETDDDKEAEKRRKEALENTRKYLKSAYEKRKRDGDEAAARERENDKQSFDHWKYYQDLKARKNQEYTDEQIAIMEDAAARRRRIEEDAVGAGIQIARALVDYVTQERDIDTQAIEDKYQKEIELASGNENRIKDLQAQRERDMAIARRKEKEEYKKAATQKILAETAINVVEAFPNYILMAAAAILGGLQVAQVQRLREGGWVEGPGNETSDSVPIMASKNEFMVNAAAARKSPMLLEAINSKKLDDRVLRSASGGSSFNDSRIVGRLMSLEGKLDGLRGPDIIEQGGVLFRAERRGSNYRKLIRTSIASR